MELEAAQARPVPRRVKPGTREPKRPEAIDQARHPGVPTLGRESEPPQPGVRAATPAKVSGAKREPSLTAALQRLRKVEGQYRALRIALLAVVVILGLMVVNQFHVNEVNAGNTLIKSEELKLVDSSGRARVFLRMYSNVPVMQVLDAEGNPRLSFGLRFDDTPFIDLSDSSGMTRATFQVGGGGEPAFRMFDGRGESTFSIN